MTNKAEDFCNEEFQKIKKSFEIINEADDIHAERKIFLISQLIVKMNRSISRFELELKDYPGKSLIVDYYRELLSPKILLLMDDIIKHN